MKRLITAGVLALIVAAVCVTGHFTVTSESRRLEERLGQAYDAAERGDADSAGRAAEETERLYEKAERKIAFFVDHKLVEELGVSISRLRPLAQAGDLGEFCAECTAARTRIRHILNDERTSFSNLF